MSIPPPSAPRAVRTHKAAIRTPTDRVYEHSCGEADFLLAAGERLRELGASRGGRPRVTADGTVSDFFDVDLWAASFDAIVGNPPYRRYQAFQGEPRAKAQAAALKAGVRLTGLASSWAALTVR